MLLLDLGNEFSGTPDSVGQAEKFAAEVADTAAGVADAKARDAYLSVARISVSQYPTAARIVDAVDATTCRQVHRPAHQSFVRAVAGVEAVCGARLAGIGDDHDGHPMLTWETSGGEMIETRYVDYDESSTVEYLGAGWGWSEDSAVLVGGSDVDESEFDDLVNEAHAAAYWAVHESTEKLANTAKQRLVAATRS